MYNLNVLKCVSEGSKNEKNKKKVTISIPVNLNLQARPAKKFQTESSSREKFDKYRSLILSLFRDIINYLIINNIINNN